MQAEPIKIHGYMLHPENPASLAQSTEISGLWSPHPYEDGRQLQPTRQPQVPRCDSAAAIALSAVDANFAGCTALGPELLDRRPEKLSRALSRAW